jgi:cobalt transporter subunit CbtA
MMKSMLTSAMFAGFAVGLFAALLHFWLVQPQLLLAEQYESGALVHSQSGTRLAEEVGHDHATPTMPAADAQASHDHSGHGNDAEPPATQRNALTVIFAGLIYVAYALILVAGFGLAKHFGHRITAREGLLWGVAGFFAFQMAPAMGLAPELPGTIAADLAQRQIWWWGTVASTATGLALFGYGKTWATTALGIALLAAPHIIGAPVPDDMWGAAPPELAAGFSARVLGVSLVVWAALGTIAGYLWDTAEV